MNFGIVLPFSENEESSMIVRIVYNDVKIFCTRTRKPFLVFFETVDPREIAY